MMPSTSASSSSSSSSFSSLSSSSKPQAVVVGVIREEDPQPAKVLRLEGDTDIHHRRDNSQIDAANAHPSIRDCEYVGYTALGRSTIQDVEDCGRPLASSILPSPSLHRTGKERVSNPNLVDAFSMNIKKEMEYDDESTVSTIISNTSCEYQKHESHHLQHPQHHYVNHNSPSLIPPTLSPSQPQSTTTLPTTPLPTTPVTPTERLITPETLLTSPARLLTTIQVNTAVGTSTATEAATSTASGLAATQHKHPSHIQPSLDKQCDGFSIREAMELLHPEKENPDESTPAASVLDALLDTSIRAEFDTPFSSCPAPRDQHSLSEAECAKLEELNEANKGILAPLCEDYNFKDLSNPSLINIINLTEIVIRRLIKMAKRINSFKNLCQEDQIALLKGGCTEMMLLHSVSAYDPDKDSWKIRQDHSNTKDIKLKVLKAAAGNVYEEHKRFVLAFDPEWKQDPQIIFLLCAITLFNPKRQHILHTDTIRHEQGRYGTCLGRSMYHQLLHRLAHLHHLSEDHLRLFLEVNPTQVEPLLIEIFDLKQK